MTPTSFGDAATRLCGLAAALLGWRPDEFWNATPAELETALGGGGESLAPTDRATIDALRQRFPD